MTKGEPSHSYKSLYWFTGSLGIIGFVLYLCAQGPKLAASFALGAAGSLGNLWLWDLLSRFIAPSDRPKKAWQAGLFIGRYIILWGAGYAIVKVLGVNALAVVLGLLASTAAVLASLIIEIIQGFLGTQPTS
jgi:hypothetical protein